ncbi:hypothetical protein V7S43_002666 [Phytophthora oleae]|uniref:Uncharacterized protein n=1 Tax=Phytophthora oleae TaxID=2107226 RepID=A0ABD3G0C9_9STRA
MDQQENTNTNTNMNTNTDSSSTALASSDGAIGTARGSRSHAMDDELRPWDLYALSGALSPDTINGMKEYFRRF